MGPPTKGGKVHGSADKGSDEKLYRISPDKKTAGGQTTKGKVSDDKNSRSS